MKYWNKGKNVRLRCWTYVQLFDPVKRDKEKNLFGKYQGWTTWKAFSVLKLELQRHHGKGKFYIDIMIKAVWFEKAKDATWFILTHPEEME